MFTGSLWGLGIWVAENSSVLVIHNPTTLKDHQNDSTNAIRIPRRAKKKKDHNQISYWYRYNHCQNPTNFHSFTQKLLSRRKITKPKKPEKKPHNQSLRQSKQNSLPHVYPSSPHFPTFIFIVEVSQTSGVLGLGFRLRGDRRAEGVVVFPLPSFAGVGRGETAIEKAGLETSSSR